MQSTTSLNIEWTFKWFCPALVPTHKKIQICL